MENITALIITVAGMITAIANFYVTWQKAKTDVKSVLPKRIKNQIPVDSEIIDKLENLKEYLNADRVQIYDFHNGGHYANGRSALKTSCSYEVVRTGIKGRQKELQAVPISCIPHFIHSLLKNTEMKVNDIEEIKDKMPATYELKKSQDVESFYDVILNNKDGEPIGFLAIQYCKKDCVNYKDEEKYQIKKVKDFIEDKLEKMNK